MAPTLPDAERITFVLDRPSHPGNIGAAARALKVMGLERLAVVRPREPGFATHPEARAFASGALDLLERAQRFDSLEQALADATLVIAVSAGTRELAPPASDPEPIAEQVRDELEASAHHRVALVFGTERTGLSIEDARRAQLLCTIPGNPEYASLNLAQAVMLLAYCLRRVQAPRVAQPVSDGVSLRGYATQQQIEGLLEHLERMAVVTGFLDPAAPKRLMPRLRRLLARTRVEVEEVDILRGMCRAAIEAAQGGAAKRDREEDAE
ncbi:MAG: TrmJ/YjtD family RNA methyltransferase [Burkholderiales bacterium]|nr:MAG: TrmJ/YjtD family RNA methyltransferase [Burkholderiales bacterium]